MKKLSVIVPCFNEEESIPYFYEEIKKVTNSMNVKLELIFVDDGSRDKTLEVVKKLNEDKYAFVPILRAGMGMLEGITRVIPNAKIGHIGMYRDEETFEPVNYFFKVPKHIEDKEVIILDPMLATGGSAVDAIELLKSKGVKKMKFLCIIAAPEGLERVQKEHPDVQIYCAHIDDHLNENKYIVPGLGDAGDRIFGTK